MRFQASQRQSLMSVAAIDSRGDVQAQGARSKAGATVAEPSTVKWP